MFSCRDAQRSLGSWTAQGNDCAPSRDREKTGAAREHGASENQEKRVSVAPTHDPLYSQATGFGPLSCPLNQDRLHRFVGQILGQMLFDFKTQKWVALANTAAWSCWSRDG